MREKILEFIFRRFNDDCHWTDGNCYYFAVILKARFTNGEIWYDAVDDHFIFKIENHFYDWNGTCIQYEIDDKLLEHVYKWDEYKKIDPVHYERIIKDVIR